MRYVQFKGLIVIFCLLAVGCTHRTVTRIESLQAPCPRVLSQENDTLSYVVAFNDTNEREAFVSSFNQFLKKYPFVNMMKDTVRNYVRIELLPPTEQPHLEQPITRIEQNQIVEDIIEEIIEEVSSDSAPEAIDSILPGFGGVVRIYFPVKMLTRFFPVI